MTQKNALHWFTRDLRLSDNPALTYAVRHRTAVVPVFIHDPAANYRALGGASLWWLGKSLAALKTQCNDTLLVEVGETVPRLLTHAKDNAVDLVTLTVDMDPARQAFQKSVAEALRAEGLEVKGLRGNTLWDVDRIVKADGTPYKVFTPFYRKGCLSAKPPRAPLPVPEPLSWVASSSAGPLPQLQEPHVWMKGLNDHWTPGEEGAQARLITFVEKGLKTYKEGRNIPSQPSVSRLSPHLAWGEISPHQAWAAAAHRQGSGVADADIDTFQSELGWREFSYSLLTQKPKLSEDNWSAKFDGFPWSDVSDPVHAQALKAWQQGLTGIPIVDAGMRELWTTGYMHNRVRMIVGSFLVKNLLLHWQNGEAWFWDTLADADPANNAASWQWVAGSGADAAPYFRIFNPVTQAQKFDPEGTYIRQWVPELKPLINKHLFAPWEAPVMDLLSVGVSLGKTYPHPIVELKQSRQRALDAFQSLKDK